MKKYLIGCLVLILFSCMSALAQASVDPNELSKPQGFQVLTKGESGWTSRGMLRFELPFAERSADLSAALPDNEGAYKIRVQHGPEGVANLDAVFLRAGTTTLAPTSAVDLKTGEDLLKKLASSDYDVINAQGRTIEIGFEKPASSQRLAIVISGREEDPRNLPGGPCAYPGKLHPASDHAEVFRYQLSSNPGAIVLDGAISAKDRWGTPLFQSFTRPITGHPDGTTYGYVKNDEEFLYGAVDFTSDNTFDGTEDFASLLIRTPAGWRRFTVNIIERQWGDVAFAYSEQVPYQHKMYEFAIPLKEIGFDAHAHETVDMIMLAYGTSGCPNPLEVTAGEHTPPARTQFLGDLIALADMLQIRIVHNGNYDVFFVYIGDISVTGSGTGHEVSDIAAAKLYEDVNADGKTDPGDLLLASGTFSGDDGKVLFDLSSNDYVVDDHYNYLLVAYDLLPTAISGSTYAASIAAPADVTIATDSPCKEPTTVVSLGSPPQNGNLVNVGNDGMAEAQAGPGNPAAQEAGAGDLDVPMLQIAVSAGPNEPLKMQSLTITDDGAVENAASIAAVRLWEDADGSGTVTAGDTQLNADQAFTQGTATLDLLASTSSEIPKSGSKDYLVTYSFAASTAVARSSLFDRASRFASRLAGEAVKALGMPFTLAGCGGSGVAPATTTLSGLPEGFLFTDQSGSEITLASAGDVVQVRTDQGELVLQFIMGSSAVSFDGATLARDANGTLIALSAAAAQTLAGTDGEKAVSGLPAELIAFVSCQQGDNLVEVCPKETMVPSDPLACAGALRLTPTAPSAGGYTWPNPVREDTADCQVSGAAALFDHFYAFGAHSISLQASVEAPAAIKLTGADSSHLIAPTMSAIAGGELTLVTP